MKSQGSLSFVDEEIEEFPAQDNDPAELENSSVSSISSKPRGRRRIPECWTRVISMENDDVESLKTHVLATDLLVGAGLSGFYSKKRVKKWMPLFSCHEFLFQNKQINLETFELTSKEK